ncbi:MAG: enoyl-CoA hydratase/isomerase family protein [Burkholderiales bacterium]|nr:enoyl-CoA hydratase/isomerase family protein [Burkholderiales bacterium]
MSELVLSEVRGAARWLTINRPRHQNAVVWELFPPLMEGIRAASRDPAIRAIVITGAGERFFCGGGDLQHDRVRSERGLAPEWLTHPIVQLFRVVEDCGLPIVARVNGHAMAPGMSLLAMCDLAVASERAMFGVPEVKVGLFPGLGLAYLQRLVPQRRLVELVLTGEPMSAQEALAHGLVNYVVPAAELDAKLQWLLGRLLDKSPEAQRRAKHAMKAMRDMTLAQAFAHANANVSLALLTEDFREGVAAFSDGRPPLWPPRGTQS